MSDEKCLSFEAAISPIASMRQQWLFGDLKRVLDAIPACILLVDDPGGSAIYGNSAARALQNGGGKLVADAPITWNFEAFDAAGVRLPADRLPMQRAARGETIKDAQFELRSDEGVNVCLHGASAPLHDEDGAICGAIGAFTDVSSWKMRERKLNARIVEAERANLAKSRFLTEVSHDLRQPVQSMITLMAVIRRQLADRPDLAKVVIMTEDCVKSLNAMLAGVLESSRLDSGFVQPVIASVDLGALVSRLAREYLPRAAKEGLVLRCRPGAFLVRTDAALLERILRNLVENALRYTAKGGVLIGFRPRGDSVRLDVIDTGIGIPLDKQAEIFEEFRQLDNPARHSSQGVGLGLAIVSRLASILGTEVQVSSQVGRGTRFSLLLPLAPPHKDHTNPC